MARVLEIDTKTRNHPAGRFYNPLAFWRKLLLASFLLCLILNVAACNKEQLPAKVSSTRFIMDTLIQIDAQGKDEAKAQEAVNNALRIMQDIADITDRYSKSEKSDLVRINRQAGLEAVEVSDETLYLADFVKRQEYTLVDITLGPVTDLWAECRDRKELPDEEEMEEALDLTGMDKLVIDRERKTIYLEEEGMSLDLGAIAKGWAVEQAGRFLAGDKSISCALVNGGGNIKAVGTKPDKTPWRVGVQDPRTQGEHIGVLLLDPGEAVATSGDYQRYFELEGERYHHLLQPSNGWPGRENISATVLTNNAFLADYYSTLFFLLPTEEGLALAEKLPNVEVVLVRENRVVHISSGLKDRFIKNEAGKWFYRQN